MRKTYRTSIVSVLLAIPTLFAQAPSSFDVVSVKPHKDPTLSRDPFIRGRRVFATASTLADLLTYAYNLRYDQLSGAPAWANSDHYDIEAKAPDGDTALSVSQSQEMIKRFLADRFQLKVHQETQEVAVYALVVGKNGPKLNPVERDAKEGGSTRGTGKGLHYETKKGTIADLADQLSFTAGRPVLDKTGLSGYYAFTLDWFPASRIPPPDLETPSMFVALQEQLGLRLESTKGPVEKLIIDHAEKPSEN